jgi:manganese efflux pump family protein
VKLAIRIAAVAGAVFTALVLSGCAAHATGTGGTSEASIRACTAYGVRAIERHVTVTWTPAPCRGLSKAEVNQAVATAVLRVAGDAPKALRRKRAAEASTYLYRLVTALPPVASSPPTVSRTPAPGRGRDLPMAIAALIAWLVTAGSGAYILGSWIAHGGTLRWRPASADAGSPPWVISGHFGLALGGLAAWVAYLITGWTVGLPRRRSPAIAGQVAGPDAGAAGAAGGPLAVSLDGGGAPGVARTAVIGAGDVRRDRAAAGSASRESTGTGGTGGASVSARLSPLVVAAHGALAVTTMLLVLLAALGSAAS